MTITDTIAWLRRLAVVSCPTITCQQAAEVAEMLEEQQQKIDEYIHAANVLAAQGVNEFYRVKDLTTERDALKTALDQMADARDSAIKERDVEKNRATVAVAKCLMLDRLVASLTEERDDEAAERDRVYDLLGKRNDQFSAKCADVIRLERERDALREALDVDADVEWHRRCLIAEKERDALKAEVEIHRKRHAASSLDGARCDECLKVAIDVDWCMTHEKNFCRACHSHSGPAKPQRRRGDR